MKTEMIGKLGSTFAVLALTGTAQGDVSPWMSVTKVRTYESGSAIITVDKNISTTCSNKKDFIIRYTQNGSEEMIRTVTAALLSGREIRVNTSNTCHNANDIITWAEIR